MKKIVYKILGTLPAPYEDFYSQNPDYPHLTISAQSDEAEEDSGGEIVDGFINCVVPDVAMIDDALARQIIAAKIADATADDVEIIADGICQAV